MCDHVVLRHVCHPVLFHAGSSVLWLLEKLLFCLTQVGEKNSQDNFWKKIKKGKTEMPHSCSLATLVWSQPWGRAGARLCCCKSSFGGAPLTLLLPSEAQPLNLGIWKEGWNNTPLGAAGLQNIGGCPCSKKNKLEAVQPGRWEFVARDAYSNLEKKSYFFIIACLSRKRIASIRSGNWREQEKMKLKDLWQGRYEVWKRDLNHRKPGK